MPTTEIVNIPISDGFEAKVLLQLPPNMDRSGKTKYPLLVDVYGGPDSYSVSGILKYWNTDTIKFYWTFFFKKKGGW